MEVEIRVTVQVDADTDASFSNASLQETAVEAISNAVKFIEGAGFSHKLAHEVSIGVVDVSLIDSDMAAMMQAESEIRDEIAKANPQGD